MATTPGMVTEASAPELRPGQVTREQESWLMTEDAFIKTLEQETAMQAAMLNGDPGPLISYWADRDDITVFGGWGRTEKGRKPVTDAMRWAASRFTGADAVDSEHIAIACSGDLAYTAGFERSHVSVDGAPRRDMTLRVTHIYRRTGGGWKLIHRHADFPPDPRTTLAQ